MGGVVPETGIEPVRPLRKAGDFKSHVSTNFTTQAVYALYHQISLTYTTRILNLAFLRITFC
jgi:hypothetical protein